MCTKVTEWSYYIAEYGETAEDATPLRVYDWQCVHNVGHAAELAAEDEWDNRDGREAGVGKGPTITVISPDGVKTSFSTEREASVEHYVTELGQPT